MPKRPSDHPNNNGSNRNSRSLQHNVLQTLQRTPETRFASDNDNENKTLNSVVFFVDWRSREAEFVEAQFVVQTQSLRQLY
mmetsp:Transcript_4031/g.9617  ORF Transcript_4031/g.9617 Transcript_4031/m.9617 type:complete len:81 (-) Transcript_4031:972-1214(-)